VLWLTGALDVLAQGLDERRARARARSAARTTSWGNLMRASALDFRHGLRLLRRYPTTSCIAVATLALGIGANTAIFTVVDAVLLRQLPYPDPDRLVMVWEKRPRENTLVNVVSPADFLDWRRRNDVFQSIAAMTNTSTTITGDGEPLQVPTGVVSWAFFDALGVGASRGRTFVPDDEIVGRHRNVVITHGFWKRRYGGDPAVVGRTMTINGNAWQIVGVLPESFRFVDADLDLWVPLIIEAPGAPAPTRAGHQFFVYARL
jgi:putative ABC transport system permease protein